MKNKYLLIPVVLLAGLFMGAVGDTFTTLMIQSTSGVIQNKQTLTHSNALRVVSAPSVSNDVVRLQDLTGATNALASLELDAIAARIAVSNGFGTNTTLVFPRTTGLTNTLGFFLGGSGAIGTNGSTSVLTINMNPIINGTLTNNGGGFFGGNMTFGTNKSASVFTVNMIPNFTQGFTVETSNGSPNEVSVDATNCIMRFRGTAGISLPHAALSHTNTLTSLGTTAPNCVPFNVNEDLDPAISHVAGSSNIVFLTPGTYELIASIVALASGPGKHADFWFTLNTTNIPRSDTYITMPSAAGNVIAVALQYPFASNDVVQLVWASDDDAGFTLPATTNKLNPSRPVSPSVILSIKQVSKD